jgi:type VI secretion system secreted protein Hcp
MSIAMYLTIPGVVGGSTAPGWTGSLDILAFSWGASNPGTAIGTPGKANFQDLSVTSYIDTATAALSQHMFSGVIRKQAVLTVIYPAPGPSGTATDVYTLSNVLVSSVSLGGSGGEDKLTVNYSFNYGALNFLLHGKRATWDLATNSPGVAD